MPLDNRALMALKGSALALDVYAWLAHRLYRIEGKTPPIHWHSLREQFAQEYTWPDADKNFKKKFLPALKKVLAVYPQAKVKRAKVKRAKVKRAKVKRAKVKRAKVKRAKVKRAKVKRAKGGLLLIGSPPPKVIGSPRQS